MTKQKPGRIAGPRITPKQEARLHRLCTVVRECLGLDRLVHEYVIDLKDRSSNLAYSLVPKFGWRIEIVFPHRFFQSDLHGQIETIIHEHLHAAMIPYDQAVMHIEMGLPKSVRKMTDHNLTTAREIMVEAMTTPIFKLMEAEIRKAL